MLYVAIFYCPTWMFCWIITRILFIFQTKTKEDLNISYITNINLRLSSIGFHEFISYDFKELFCTFLIEDVGFSQHQELKNRNQKYEIKVSSTRFFLWQTSCIRLFLDRLIFCWLTVIRNKITALQNRTRVLKNYSWEVKNFFFAITS